MGTLVEYRRFILENAAFWGHSPPSEQDISESWDRELERRDFQVANEKLMTALYSV